MAEGFITRQKFHYEGGHKLRILMLMKVVFCGHDSMWALASFYSHDDHKRMHNFQLVEFV